LPWWSAHCHWWDEVTPRLLECGHVLALDFRGHGRSQWASSYGLAAYLDDLTWFIRDHLRRRVVLVGHSMGGEAGRTPVPVFFQTGQCRSPYFSPAAGRKEGGR
jgi:pimeloyl-ACP methyl ester carboxylesterase